MGQPVPALTMNFIKKEGFKVTFRYREGVCTMDLNWELVLENRGLVAEGSVSHISFRDPRN